MAVTGKQVLVGTTAVDLFDLTVPAGGEAVILNQGAASVFLGGSGVTTSTGYELKTTATPLRLLVGQNQQLYAIVASGTNRVDVILSTNV